MNLSWPGATLLNRGALLLRYLSVLGGVLASFAVEKFSLDRLRSLTQEEIRARYGEFRQLTRFDDLELDILNGTRS